MKKVLLFCIIVSMIIYYVEYKQVNRFQVIKYGNITKIFDTCTGTFLIPKPKIVEVKHDKYSSLNMFETELIKRQVDKYETELIFQRNFPKTIPNNL